MCNVFRRIRSRRGGGGVERGGDPWVALGGGTIPGLGDPRVPTPLHTAPAPTRSRPLPMGFLPNTYPCGRPRGGRVCYIIDSAWSVLLLGRSAAGCLRRS